MKSEDKTTSRPKKSRKTSTKKPKEEPTTEKIYAYKVFSRRSDGNGGSILISRSVRGKLQKDYFEGRKTEANSTLLEAGYGLCVFPNLEDANRWANGETWLVEVGLLREPASQRPSIKILPDIADSDKDKKTNYRTILSRIKKHLDRDRWPTGCKMADYVIPIEKVT